MPFTCRWVLGTSYNQATTARTLAKTGQVNQAQANSLLGDWPRKNRWKSIANWINFATEIDRGAAAPESKSHASIEKVAKLMNASADTAIHPQATSALALQWTASLRQQSSLHKVLAESGLVMGGVLLMVGLTLVRIPTVPVPITGQSLGVLLIGAALGWQRGSLSVAGYLLLGLAGAPVFATVSGPAAFFGPTAGYLVAFLPAAALVGWLAERGWDRRLFGALVTFLSGHAVIFALGVSWLAVLLGNLELAFYEGFVPFIPGMALKTAIATALLPLAWAISPFGKAKTIAGKVNNEPHSGIEDRAQI